jgi:hypothetical protein
VSNEGKGREGNGREGKERMCLFAPDSIVYQIVINDGEERHVVSSRNRRVASVLRRQRIDARTYFDVDGQHFSPINESTDVQDLPLEGGVRMLILGEAQEREADCDCWP